VILLGWAGDSNSFDADYADISFTPVSDEFGSSAFVESTNTVDASSTMSQPVAITDASATIEEFSEAAVTGPADSSNPANDADTVTQSETTSTDAEGTALSYTGQVLAGDGTMDSYVVGKPPLMSHFDIADNGVLVVAEEGGKKFLSNTNRAPKTWNVKIFLNETHLKAGAYKFAISYRLHSSGEAESDHMRGTMTWLESGGAWASSGSYFFNVSITIFISLRMIDRVIFCHLTCLLHNHSQLFHTA